VNPNYIFDREELIVEEFEEKIAIEPKYLPDHLDSVHNLIERMNSASHEQLIGVAGVLAEIVVEAVTRCPDQETRFITELELIKHALSGEDCTRHGVVKN
jgi:hypothetical protein